MIDDLVTSWIGGGYRHINAESNRDILDFSYAGQFPDNRWNAPGQPALYFAGDIGVAIAEWGRRFPVSFDTDALKPATRDVYRLQFRFDAVLDLRNPEIIRQLHIPDAPTAFRDKLMTRSLATQIRHSTRAQAMLVPSIAFLDDLTRWNLVVFLDKMPEPTASWITKVERVGPLAWNPNQHPSC